MVVVGRLYYVYFVNLGKCFCEKKNVNIVMIPILILIKSLNRGDILYNIIHSIVWNLQNYANITPL